jgi:hypothetical protein
MDLMVNKQLDAEVLVGIQQKDCVLKGEIEKTNILSCEKTKLGLLCILETTVLTSHQNFDYYSLINYEGIQLKFEEGQYLVKQGTTWFTLKCKNDFDDRLDSFDTCQQIKLDSDCSTVLKREKIDPFLENCLFEKSEPTPSEIILEGILLQGENLEIQLLDSLTDHRPDKISKAPPMIIMTNKIVRITKDDFEETLHPKNRAQAEKIIDS